MPDANGNFKGIALGLDADRWARIFGRPAAPADVSAPPPTSKLPRRP